MFDILKGHYIYNADDLLQFVCDVTNNDDKYMEERKKINDIVNKFQDGNYSQYVLDKLVQDKGF